MLNGRTLREPQERKDSRPPVRPSMSLYRPLYASALLHAGAQDIEGTSDSPVQMRSAALRSQNRHYTAGVTLIDREIDLTSVQGFKVG